jgi:hypothetical protein
VAPDDHDVGMPTWDDVVAIATALPEVEQSTSYRTRCVLGGGGLCAGRPTEAEGGLVLMCRLDEKEALLASGDPAFSTTPHYDGYGAILVDLEKVSPDQLAELIEEAWRERAPVRLQRQFDATRPG